MMELEQFLRDYANSGISRFHMPGHKGNFPPLSAIGNLSQYDITEIDGADYLFQSTGILRRLEERIAAFYKVYGSAVSTGGSTLCIQAMLAAFQPGDRILAARNAHTAFVNACALLDLKPVWILPKALDTAGVSGAVTPEQVAEAIAANPDAKGVYLTSPDYLGILSDVAEIARLCHASGLLCVVDNAHGAALKLSEPDLHPMAQGADICCDSAHKTLPVLTGGAFLHYTDRFTTEQIKAKMALFGSTSPSYLTMLSIALCMDWLEKNGVAAYRETAARIAEMKACCAAEGVPCLSAAAVDPFRLSIRTGLLGLDDTAAGAFFRAEQIEPEYVGGGYTVLLATPFQSPRDWERLRTAVHKLGKLPQGDGSPFPALCPPEVIMPPRQAVFSESETVPTGSAVNRIAAQTVITCPPGVPILVPGEKITAQTENILKNSGIFTVKVLK